MEAKVGYETVSMFMTHAIFAEAMRVMIWAYDWGDPDHAEDLVVADFEGWNPEVGKFNGPPPGVGDVIRLSGSEVSIVVKRATFDRGWKVEIGLAVALEVEGVTGLEALDETIDEPAQPRSYRLDYKPGELREPEQVFDESALASLEGKPATIEPAITGCVVTGTPELKPFPRHILVFLEWDHPTGVAVMTGPARLFEPEHLTIGGCGDFGDEVLLVVEILLTGDNREGAVAKVTAQRLDDGGTEEG